MQVRKIEYPHALKIGDTILIHSVGFKIGCITDFLRCGDYPGCIITVDPERSEYYHYTLKELTDNSKFILLLSSEKKS